MKLISKDFLTQPTVKKHLSLIFIGFLLGMLTYGFVHFNGFQNSGESLLSGLLGIFLAYIVHYSNSFINALVPWKKNPGLRLLTGILFDLAVVSLFVLIFLWGYGKLFDKPSLFLEETYDVLVKIGILLFCAVLIYNIIYFAFYSYYEYSKGQLMEIKLKRKQSQLQLHALKSQLSPHFLFNCMNTLSSLFQKDTARAELFIRSMANSYGYVLNHYEAPLVTVAEELVFVRAYCFLMRTRFGEYLNLDVQLTSEACDSKIPPMTLQMLVENAVKHNVLGPGQILEMHMTVDSDKLVVSNNKTTKRPEIDSLKIGLRNIAARYELLAKRSITILDNSNFTVELPLIE